jgi:heme/copper-type cytochrome/quinol oxidase subunit 3
MSDFAVHAQRRDPRVSWWGMAMFAAAEATLFGLMIASYFYLRFKNIHWPPNGIPEPKVALPFVLLGVLLATSAPMQLAVSAAHAGRVGRARLLLVAALVVQAAYLGVSLHQYAADLDRFTPQQHAYGSLYFTLLGADHAHVAVGLLLNGWLIAKLVRGLTRYRVNALTAIALYWHAVNAITIAVTLTILSPAL